MAGGELEWHPAGRNRQLEWPEETGGWSEDRLWLLDALRHWAWHRDHGFEGRRMRNKELAAWCGVSASTITSWIRNGGVAPRGRGLDFCQVAQERSGCSPDCASGFGDRDVLAERYAKAAEDFAAAKDQARHRTSRPRPWPAAHGRPLKDVAGKLAALKRAHDGVLRVLGTVTVSPFGSGLDKVTLEQVRVERVAEKEVIRHVDRQLDGKAPGQAAALLGEPGVGKSCSLWGVHKALAKRPGLRVVVLSATSLLAGAGREPDLRPHELPRLLEAHAGEPAGAPGTRGRAAASGRPRIVLLLDTADLLLHETETARDFTELITVLRSRNIAVALACRSGEAGLLKRNRDAEEGEGAYTSLLSNIPLGLYGTGKDDRRERGWTPDSELGRAIAAHGRAYAPSRRDEDGSRPRMEQALAEAAARGLPLSRLVRHPLHLRMIFDLYSPHGPEVAELDAAGLFHDYWERRVERDLRDAVTDLDAVAPEEARRLGRAAAELGLATLFRGTTELHREHARDLLASRCGVPSGTAARWTGLLVRRGVLSEGLAGRVRFHHQVIGEYAAGRGLADAPAGLAAAARRIVRHPQDLYLAEAARHAFHHTDRSRAHESRRWYPHLAKVARAAAPVARDTYLRVFAGLRHAPLDAVADAVAVVREPETGTLHAEQYMDALGGVVRPAEDIWPTVLRAVWDTGGAPLRPLVVRTLTALVEQQRGVVVPFLYGLDAGELARHAPAPHLTALMCQAHAYDTEPATDDARTPSDDVNGADRADGTGSTARTAVAVMREMLDEVFVQRGAPLERALAALAGLAARRPDRYGELCRGLPRRMSAADRISKDVDTVIASAAACWAAVHRHERTADTLRTVRERLTGPADGPPDGELHVVLHGAASKLCHPDARTDTALLRSALDDAAAAAATDGTRKAVARYFLRPLLLAGETPAGRAARAWCRDRTGHEAVRQEPRPPGTALALTALGVLGGRRLPGAVVAACLPDDPRSARPRTDTLLPWTTAPWDTDLTVAAAAGGHHLAVRALDLLAGGTAPAPEAPGTEGAEGAGEIEGAAEDTKNTGETGEAAAKGRSRRRGKQPRKRLAPPREEVVARVPEAPGLLLPWLLRDAEERGNADAVVGFVRASERRLPTEHPEHLRALAAHLAKRDDHRAAAAAHRLTARMISHGMVPLGSPGDLVRQVESLNTSTTAQTELLQAVAQALAAGPAPWDLPRAREVLTPCLDGLVDRAAELSAGVGRPGQEGVMLAGEAAQLLRVRLAVLDARGKVAAGAGDLGPVLEEVEALVFLPPDLCLPSGHSLAQPGNVWPRRFDTVPRLCVDLHEAGHRKDAERLLERAVTVATARSGASARWRNAGWNPWRPYLRLLVAERSRLYDLLVGYGPRDHQLTRHLLEVAGQAVTDISDELHRLLADPAWPAELHDAARRTASWAGRDGANLRWETLYEDITAS
ncbi:hypothetical protein AB0E83_18880 [Streptomyces sp. NPDC035033]|uniref:hypothetical protein n=1 Tax=Streptomyces sp. NPDC035033 TaxID=3155368 RepID=UPI0033D4AA76